MADTTANSGGSLAGIAQLLSLFTDKETTSKTSGSTETSKVETQLSGEQVQKLLQTALESNQGLASVAAGQASAGMYNSTVNQQLTNDLLSRLTTQVATSAAPKVTTATTTPKTVVQTTPASLGGNGFLGLMAASAAKGYIDPYITGKKKIGDLLGKFTEGSSGTDLTASIASGIPEVSNTAMDSSMQLTTVNDLLTGALSASQNLDFSSLNWDTTAIADNSSGAGLDFGALNWDTTAVVPDVSIPDVELDWDSLEWDW